MKLEPIDALAEAGVAEFDGPKTVNFQFPYPMCAEPFTFRTLCVRDGFDSVHLLLRDANV